MKKCEYYMTRSDGVILVKTYSDNNKYIKQLETGLDIDIGVYEYGEYHPLKYTYIETEKDIEEV